MTALVGGRPPARMPARGAGAVAGAARLARFALHRDRVRIAVWVVALAGLIGYFGAIIPVVYPDAAARQTRAAIMREPSGALLTGPGYGLEDYTFGVMIANEMLGLLAVAAALMSVFLVVRHTRAEEEVGRTDLVRAGAVGRQAPLVAALVDAVVTNAAVAVGLAVALVANDLPPADSLAVAAGVAAVGLVFAAVAAVTAQLTTGARAATGAAGALLALAFVLRGVGDAQQVGGTALSWASPIGWAQQTRAFVDLRWWPLLLPVAAAAVLVTAAFVLSGRRDVGAGLLPDRRGAAHAAGWLRAPLGLALRLERASLVGWGVGLFGFAALTGSLTGGIVESFREQPQLAEVFGAAGGGDVVTATLSAFLGFLSMAVAVFATVTVNRLRREEADGRAAVVLAGAVGRPAWAGSQLAVALLGATMLLLASGLGLGLGAAGTAGGAIVADLTLAALAYLPVVAGFAALAALLHGAGLPAWPGWLLLVAAILVGLYGPVLDLPPAVLDVAPFALVPAVPAAALEPLPLVALTGVAVALSAFAAAAVRRRDLRG
ncbi:hypothetical protein MF406_07720 [Georgenia sp. TF02-10]|uniref:ABC transporter permease n=1 Tax=Georgenia sp. TF02-10 TaxID=2917725 RepID=UPI001FA7E0B4|nr:hypothetical protein [Georgenia sp. TF02-10]UNX56087.1 hypothetical protein MF406_07720 [Georgenia sp. TF02-10]